jgi:PAS domain S-box-containing protein
MTSVSTTDAIIVPDFSGEEIAVLKQYFEYNKRYQEELNLEFQKKLKDHPVFGPMMQAMTPEMQKAQQQRSQELQRAAIFDGQWEAYTTDLVAQGRMYARMNIRYADWYELIKLAKVMIVPLIKRDFSDPKEAVDYLDGLGKIADFAMYGIAEAYFQEKNQMIREGQEKYRIIFENSKDHILLLNTAGEIVTINHTVTNPNTEQMIGKKITEITAVENATTIIHAMKNVMEKKTSETYDTAAETKNGISFFRSTMSPVFDEHMNVKNIVIIARDVTEQKMAELDLYNLNLNLEKKVSERTEELAAINKELESFTYSVSHDLRSPLRAINGFSEILKLELGDNLSGDADDCLTEILKNTKKMGQLIDNLLEFSRLGKRPIQKRHVDMDDLFNGIVDECRRTNPKVLFHIHQLEDATGDRDMLKQVIENLVSNAVKYSSKSAKPRVEIGSERENGSLVYYVKDNGAGFNMKYYDKLFGVFQRLHGADEFEGVGVGLAIVQRVVSKHSGKVWAEGKENEGATFYFSLPAEEPNH